MYFAMHYSWRKWTFEATFWIPIVPDGLFKSIMTSCGSDLVLLAPSSCTYINSKERSFQFVQMLKRLFLWMNAYNHLYPYNSMHVTQAYTRCQEFDVRTLTKFHNTWREYTAMDRKFCEEKCWYAMLTCHLSKTHVVCVHSCFSVCQTCFDSVLVGTVESASFA